MDATVISRYAGMGGATASVAAEPQRDLLHHAKSAAPQVMAAALARTFRSDAQLSADSFHFISAVESDPASRSEPAWGSDWPRLTSKSSDIEGTGRHLWRLLERNA